MSLVDDPGWTRLLAAARRRLEATGGVLTGSISLTEPTDAERIVVIGVTGTHRAATAHGVRVRLTDMDSHIRAVQGESLVALLNSVVPLRDRPGERRREEAARAAALAVAATSRHAGSPWYADWLAALAADGTLTRLVRAGSSLTVTVRVLDALPAADEPLPVFAQRVLGDTKALTSTMEAGLVLRAVAAWQGIEFASSAEVQRELWESVGVIRDDLASQVLVLNLPATGGIVGSWLTSAAQVGVPLRLTLHQLRLAPLHLSVPSIYITENPAVLRAAVALGAAAPAMVCTSGVPSAALHRLLSYAPDATLHWRHDFDWPGVRMLTAALARYPNAHPWRMSTHDYEAGPGDGPPLLGSPAPTPWDPPLAAAMAHAGHAVMEESLLPELLADLRAAGPLRPAMSNFS